MEIRKFAEGILLAETLDEKLQRADVPFADNSPGEVWRIAEPVRPANLQFAPRRAAPAMPRPRGLTQPRNRAIAHHIMANHELQAVEVMAFILCAFPQAPAEFRHGVAKIIDDEQRHTRLHADRAEALGVPFGSLPVNCYIWKKAQSFETPLDYIAGLPLTFEGRNLDHTLEFETLFRDAGDRQSAAVMRIIHRDEIEHVRFGIDWLRKLKPANQSEWEAYCASLKWPLRPSKARGDIFQRDARLAAGLSTEFVDALEKWDDDESPSAI
ncbi:MAG: ferritin-like domain-containing protein [Planctomycetes bacterium]|nr:ferritin-like domain-containing protein [Planctomycetota bacterium]